MTKENAVRQLELMLSADEIRQKGLHQAAVDEIERLRCAIREAVEAEKEACAKVAAVRAEEWGDKWEDTPDAKAQGPLARMREAQAIAAAIRARGET